MPDPRRYTDAEFYRAYQAGAFDDLRFNAFSPGECRCVEKAWAHASATQVPEYGQVMPEEVRSCRKSELWCGGRVRLSCSNSEVLFRALSEAGFDGEEAQEAELLRRLEAAERAEEAGAKVLDFGLKALGLEPAPDRTEVLMRCSVDLKRAGFPTDGINRAGRELRKEIR